MTLKTGILAAAAALTLAIPAAALAQPGYGNGYNSNSYNSGYSNNGYRAAPAYGRYDDDRRFDREREFRREQQLRRLRWEREHAWRHDYGYYGYGR